VNCHDIFAFLKAKLGCERALSGIDQTLRASLVFCCAWVLSRRFTDSPVVSIQPDPRFSPVNFWPWFG
jgi:hypothetical protein